MNVLIAAFACKPNQGSEYGIGWNWSINLAKKHNVYVLTRKENQDAIEAYTRKHNIQNPQFYYYDGNTIMDFIDKKIPMGFRIYYKWWQKNVVPLAEKIIKDCNIEIVHQLTYNEFRTPGKLYKLAAPFVWGPIGGGHEYNPILRNAHFRMMDVLKEIIRKKMNHWYLSDKDVVGAIKDAKAVIVADPATYSILPKIREYDRLLEAAYDCNRNAIKDLVEIKNHKTIRLLYAGVMQPRKGLKIIIDALGESNFRDFELVFIGDGQDRCCLEKLIAQYGIKDRVKLLGKLTYDEVNSYYDWADLFLFPSLRDTSGNVVLESMSHGTPVIALNHNGTSEMINSDCGDLVEIESYDQIKRDYIKYIQKYYDDRELLIKKGLEARKRIESVYSWERVMDVIDSIYDRVLNDN